MKHLTITAYGRVQGVGFRNHTLAQAQKLGLAGTVENKDDGTVLIEAEGTEKQLDELLKWCEQGPDSADVSRLEVSEGTLRNPEGFTVVK